MVVNVLPIICLCLCEVTVFTLNLDQFKPLWKCDATIFPIGLDTRFVIWNFATEICVSCCRSSKGIRSSSWWFPQSFASPARIFLLVESKYLMILLHLTRCFICSFTHIFQKKKFFMHCSIDNVCLYIHLKVFNF